MNGIGTIVYLIGSVGLSHGFAWTPPFAVQQQQRAIDRHVLVVDSSRTSQKSIQTVRSHPSRRSTVLFLNRFLFDINEVDFDGTAEGERQEEKEESPFTGNTSPPVVTLPADDYRTVHASKILGLRNHDTIRAGIISCCQDANEPCGGSRNSSSRRGGQLTDTASIEWIPQGKVKKAEPLAKSGKPPGLLRIHLHDLVGTTASTDLSDNDNNINSVSLILALPRPLQLNRLLPMISQMGVDHLVLTGAQKVPKDYFGSHLFRKPQQLRDRLVEGLCQAGDVKLPQLHTTKQLRYLDESSSDDESEESLLDQLFPIDEYARVIAHPLRSAAEQTAGDTNGMAPPIRMGQVQFPPAAANTQSNNKKRKMVLAVGPEGGWAEPNELDWFVERGFQHVTLGPRTLRSDCAVVSLLALAHFVCEQQPTETE